MNRTPAVQMRRYGIQYIHIRWNINHYPILLFLKDFCDACQHYGFTDTSDPGQQICIIGRRFTHKCEKNENKSYISVVRVRSCSPQDPLRALSECLLLACACKGFFVFGVLLWLLVYSPQGSRRCGSIISGFLYVFVSISLLSLLTTAFLYSSLFLSPPAPSWHKTTAVL